MTKKIILALLLVGLSGILIWGGVNRTLAKAGENEGKMAGNASANRNQNGSEEYNHEDGYQGGINTEQADTNALGVDAASASTNLTSSEDSDDMATAQGQGNIGRGNGGQGKSGGSDPLDAVEIEALYLALDDEYHALAVYQSVIATFGEVTPFVEIAASEQRHIDALVNQFNKYALLVPENPWIEQIPPFESVQQACQTGVTAEIENAELYDQLFSMTDNSSLIRVFTNLRNASLNSHLPQFEDCQ